ncbi:unnamed protein product [Microthlaspi erraticum]|uniref:Uncharacterized protein n=1 Tax=Microthlaspi erraticum TaxID=1685480 RepID=A0A6D2KF43_9BRAS|nr:unnamed protein product [Microthlaspi erraticum]
MLTKTISFYNLSFSGLIHQTQGRACGETTSFWFDWWNPLGRLFEITGPRGYIDLGIPSDATVASAVVNRNRRRHRTEILNRIEERQNQDISLWQETIYFSLADTLTRSGELSWATSLPMITQQIGISLSRSFTSTHRTVSKWFATRP